MATLWRIIFLTKDLRTAADATARRKKTAQHFGISLFLLPSLYALSLALFLFPFTLALLFLDILDLPFVLASLIILFTGWRAVPFYKGISGIYRSPFCSFHCLSPLCCHPYSFSFQTSHPIFRKRSI